MRASVVFGLLLCTIGQAASATDCTSWRKIGPEAKRERVAGMISQHLSSHVTKRYTSESRGAMRNCLREFSEQIADEFEAKCQERPGANADVLDDIFDRYLLSCVQ